MEAAQRALSAWLAEIGLEFKPSKTRITHTLHEHQGQVGFDYLGCTIRPFPVGKTRTGRTTQQQQRMESPAGPIAKIRHVDGCAVTWVLNGRHCSGAR